MSKRLRVLLILGSLVLLLAAMASLGLSSGSRSALQKYERELRAKGEKLTLMELTRDRRSSGGDSYTVITNAAATLSNGRFDPSLLDVQKYVGPGQASVTWRQASRTYRPAGKQKAGPPGSLDTWEEYAAQIQAAQSTLREMREALKTPGTDAGPWTPWTNIPVTPRINFAAIRTAAKWLTVAAENDLHQGRLEEGLQDLEALAALARMERDEYSLVAQMIRVSVASLGLGVTWETLQAPGWTEPQLERLQRAWEPVNLAAALETGYVGERALNYEVFAQLRRPRGPQTSLLFPALIAVTPGSRWTPPKQTFAEAWIDYLYLHAYKVTCINDDELFYLRSMQESLGAIQLLKAQRPWAEAKQRMDKAVASLNRAASSFRRLRYPISMMIPSYTHAGERAIRVETERQMTLAAVALKRFQLRQGKPAPSLEALVPDLLPTVPYDYMSAKPLRYRLKADGSCLLYSVGEDGKDDDGDPTPPPGTPPGLWEGRDAVWPSPGIEPGVPPPQPDR
ncbi:MAG: hypothetical protein ACLQU3_20290 [Limisphaerales bacterium]